MIKSTFIRSLSHFGHFRVYGADAAALLHHLTTNDIKAMAPGDCHEAVLLTNKGRCLDVLTIARRDNEFVVLTSPNRRDMFAAHVRSFIGFRQDVQIEDITGQPASIGVFGADAEDALTMHQIPLPEAGKVEQIATDKSTFQVMRTSRLPHGGFWLTMPSQQIADKVWQDLNLPECDNETYNILRVEAGLPVTGLEITDAHNAWEANLDSMISLHKGCYNGQEILARLNTYEKVKQHLKGLRLSKEVPTGAATMLQSDGKNAGEITSMVTSGHCGNIALAYVKKNYEPAGTRLKVLFDGGDVDAEVVDLPF